MRRPRCRLIARWLDRLAHRIYPEALHTIEVSTAGETRTFVDCRQFAVIRRDGGPWQLEDVTLA